MSLNVFIERSAFVGIPESTCVIHVPYGCKLHYSNSYYFKNFTHIVEDVSTTVKSINCTCHNTNDGEININLGLPFTYSVIVSGINYLKSSTSANSCYNLKNLSPGNYTVNITKNELPDYSESYSVTISQPEELSVVKSKIKNNSIIYSLRGGSQYYITINNNMTVSQDSVIDLPLIKGLNQIKIFTDKLCQGMYEESINNSDNTYCEIYLNPNHDRFSILVAGEEKSVKVSIVSLIGKMLRTQFIQVPSSRKIEMDIADIDNGTYLLQIQGESFQQSLKFVKY